jgi:DNA polymerase/3'-5' exonuclease PolX/endonuclease IV
MDFRDTIRNKTGYHVPGSLSLAGTCSSLPEADVQIFLNNPETFHANIDSEDVEEAKQMIEHWKSSTHKKLFIHAPYVINLCNNGHQHLSSLKVQMKLGRQIGASGIVVHVGKYVNVGIETGYYNFMKGILCTLKTLGSHDMPLLIETPVGMKSELCVSSSDMMDVLSVVNTWRPGQIRLCVDTAHVWGAGYKPMDYINEVEQRMPGIIALIHFNGSSIEKGSQRDRHADATNSMIPAEEMQRVLEWALSRNIPVIREYSIAEDFGHTCNCAHEEEDLSINHIIASKLREMANLRKTQRVTQADRYRVRQYENAASIIASYRKPIKSAQQALQLHGIGDKISAKIEEILKNGVVQELENMPSEQKEKQHIINTFIKIDGVGDVTANKWYHLGFRTVEDVKVAADAGRFKLTKRQQAGFEHLGMIKELTRNEIQTLGIELQRILSLVNRDYKITIVGSYRRGAPKSGDMDIIIHTEGEECPNILKLFLHLLNEHMVFEYLSGSESSCEGIINESIRIDMWLSTKENLACALVAKTNSKPMNIRMRSKAHKRGYKLYEQGLFNLDTKEKIPIHNEQELFDMFECQKEY